MNKARLLKPTKSTLFIVMLMALTLVCGIIFSSLSLTKGTIAEAMSLPTGNTNVAAGTFGSNSTVQRRGQSAISTTVGQVSDFTIVDNVSWLYSQGIISSSPSMSTSANSWSAGSAQNGSPILYHIGFLHTYKITEAQYRGILNGQIAVSSEIKSGNLTMTTLDLRLWNYVGIGTASSDANALTFDGFNEVKYIINPNVSGNDNGNKWTSKDFTGARTISRQNLTNTSQSVSGGNYYYRIGFFIEIWPDRQETLSLSNVSMSGELYENKNLMTTPGTISNYPMEMESYRGKEYPATNNYNFLQNGYETISSTTYSTTLTDNFSTADDTLASSSQTGHFAQSNLWERVMARESSTSYGTTGTDSIIFFYTFALTDEVYNGLKNGSLELSASGSYSAGGTSAPDFYAWMYVGLGKDTSAGDASYLKEFNEIVGAVASNGETGGATKVLGTTYNESTTYKPSSFSGFKFTSLSSTQNSHSYSDSSSGTKYLRIGMYARVYGEAASTFTFKVHNMSLRIAEPPIAGNQMSTPGTVFESGSYSGTGGGGQTYYGWHSQRDVMYQNKEQNSLAEISSTGTYTRTNYNDFTLVSDTDGYSGNTDSEFLMMSSSYPGWSRNTSTTKYMDNVIFMVTYKLSDSIYRGLLNGTYYITTEGGASAGVVGGSGDVDTWMYIGLGNAASDNDAKKYLGFKETSSIIGAKSDQAGGTSYRSISINNIDTRSPYVSGLKTGAIQTLNESYSSGTKYIRIAMFAEVWCGDDTSSRTTKIDSVSLRININAATSISKSSSSSNVSKQSSMTQPSDWNVYYYDDDSNNGIYSDQTKMVTISSSGSGSGYQLNSNDYVSGAITQTNSGVRFSGSSGFGTSSGVDTNSYLNFTYFANRGSSGTFADGLANSIAIRYESGNSNLNQPFYIGFFYTIKLDENVFTGLLSGKIKLNAQMQGTNKGDNLNTWFDGNQYVYFGLGTANDDDDAMGGTSFRELVGAISEGKEYLDQSSSFSISNFDFLSKSASGANFTAGASNKNISTTNSKYLRIGVWMNLYHTQSTNAWITFKLNPFTLEIIPSKDTTVPTFSGYTSNGGTNYANGPITIQDSSGLDRYTINDGSSNWTADFANVRSTSIPTTLQALGTINGKSYTLTAYDIWGNSSTLTFTYFRPVINVTGVTDGIEGDYSGGGIGLSSDTSTFSGDTYTYAYQAKTYGNTIYVHAKPKDGYYFAGILVDDLFVSAPNTNLESALNYSRMDESNLEYTFNFSISNMNEIPINGVIGVRVYFKSIETSGAGSYVYNKQEKEVVVNNLTDISGVGVVTSSATYNGSSSKPINVDTYSVVSSVLINGHVVGKKSNEQLVITPASVTASFSATNRDYNGSQDAKSITSYALNGVYGGDVVELSYSATFDSKNAGIDKTISTNNLTLTGTNAGNYTLNGVNSGTTTGTINAKAVTVTFTETGITKVYDGTTAITLQNQPLVDGMVGSESLVYDLSANYNDKNVGSNKAITLVSTTPSYENGAIASNYSITLVGANDRLGNVTQKDIIINYNYANSKAYDATTSAQVTFASFEGNVAGDVLDTTFTAHYNSKDVVSANTITINVVLTGDDAGNYAYQDTYVENGTITKKDITFTAEDKEQIYGDSAKELTYLASGFADGETVNDFTLSITRASGNDVGTYVISITAQNANYNVTAISANYVIVVREIGATFASASSKVYDGTTDVTGLISYTLTNTVYGDEEKLEISGISASVNDKNVEENKAITIANTFTLINKQGNDVAKNYLLKLENTNYTALKTSITPKDVTVNYDLTTSKVYDATNTATVSLNAVSPFSGLLIGDDLEASVSAVYNVKDVTAESILVTITLTGGTDAHNYNLSNPSVTVVDGVAITKATLTITTTSTKGFNYVYGDDVNADLGVSYVGIMGSDVISGATVSMTENGKGYVPATIGTMVTPTFEEELQNYEVNLVGKTVVVDRKALTVTYVGETIVYGATPVGTISYNGFVENENASDLVKQPKVIFDSLIPTTEPKFIKVGGYAGIIPQGAESANYNFTYAEGTLTVTKKAITAVYTNSIVYGDVAEVSFDKIDVDGLVAGDSTTSLTIASADLSSYAIVGEHVLDASDIAITASNYTVSVSGTLTITKATLTLSVAVDGNVTYGDDANAKLSVEVSGYKNGDDQAVFGGTLPTVSALTTNASGLVDAGTYTVTTEYAGAELQNYTVVHSTKSITIAKASLNVKYIGKSIVYDGKSSYLPSTYITKADVEVTGFVGGESIAFEISHYGNNNPLTSVGSVESVLVFLMDETTTFKNYTIVREGGKFEVTPCPVTFTILDQGSVYGEVVELKQGAEYYTSNVSHAGVPTLKFEGETPVNQGEYAITGTYTNANYNAIFVNGTYTISAREVTINLLDQSSDYDANEPILDQTKWEYAEGSLKILDGDSTNFNVQKALGVNAGSYEISGSYSDANYSLTINTATYTINKIALTATIEFKVENKTVKKSGLLTLVGSDFTITYSGFVGGENSSVFTRHVEVDLATLRTYDLGTYAIPYVEGESTNYNFTYVSGQIIIVADLIVITPVGFTFENATYDYDGVEKTLQFVWPDKPEHVTITHVITKGGEVVYEMKNAGEYVVTAYLSTSDPNSMIAEDFEEVARTLTINKVAVSATFSAIGLSKPYDGKVEIALSNQPIVAGMIGEETLKFNLNAKFSDKNVGVDKAITLVDLAPIYENGALEENYVVNVLGNDTLTASITPIALSVNFTPVTTKVYDRTRAQEVAFDGFVGLVDGDDVTAVLSAEYDAEDVESASEITVSIAITGVDVLNYVLSSSEEKVAGSITPKKVTATFKTVALSKEYDGNVEIALHNQPEVVGLLGGDEISFALDATFADKNVGINKTITLKDLTPSALGATKLSNYEVEVLGTDTLTASISTKAITITLKDQHHVYDGTNPTVAQGSDWYDVTAGSVIAGDELDVRITKTGTSPNSGNYPLSAVAYNANYNVHVVGAKFYIDRAETIVYFDKMVKEVEYTGSDILVTPANFEVYTNREQSTANIVYPSTVLREVGEYTLTFVVNEQVPNNYEPTTAEVKVYVVRATPTIDFTHILDKEWRYNGTEQHVIGATHTNTDAGVEVSYSGNTFLDVPENNTLTFTVTLSETANYKSVSATCTITVLKANYDVSAVRFDNGDYDYSGEYRYLEVVGLPAGIGVTYTVGSITQDTPIMIKDAGIYTVRASYTYDERNYNKPVIIETARLTINRINITVEVEGQSGYYGEEPVFNPAGIKVIAGSFIEGDTFSLDLKLEPKDSYPIGHYQLVADTTSSGNYNIVVAKGSYDVLPRPVTFRIEDKESQYGDEDVPLSYVLDESSPYSILEGDLFTASLVREEGKLPKEGGYAIMGAITNPNYKATVIPGKYNVVPRAISIIVYDQEGTNASHLSKKEYRVVRTKGQGSAILRGDDLKIQVVAKDEIGDVPGAYALTASYNEELAHLYEVKIVEAKFTLRIETRITVTNKIFSKLYDGVPYSFDIIVSSGATPQVTVDGIFMDNAFTEVGIYEITIIAPVIGDYAEPDPYRFTFEIRPIELVAEQGGVIFTISKEGGFGADETLDVHQTQELVLSGDNYTSEIDSAYSIYVVKGEERIPLNEYAENEKVTLKVKLSEELQQIGVSTWFMDNDGGVLHTALETDENGFVEVEIENGMHVLFVAERQEATPILIVGSSMGLAFIILFLFYLFRRKAI